MRHVEEEEEEEVVEEAKNDKNVEIVLPPQNSPVKQSPVKKLDLSALISHDVDDIRTVSWRSNERISVQKSKKLDAKLWWLYSVVDIDSGSTL